MMVRNDVPHPMMVAYIELCVGNYFDGKEFTGTSWKVPEESEERISRSKTAFSCVILEPKHEGDRTLQVVLKNSILLLTIDLQHSY